MIVTGMQRTTTFFFFFSQQKQPRKQRFFPPLSFPKNEGCFKPLRLPTKRQFDLGIIIIFLLLFGFAEVF